MTNFQLKLAFCGTSSFAAFILDKLIANNFSFKAAITQPDMPVGRKQIMETSPVKKTAKHHKIPVFQPSSIKNKDFIRQLSQLNPDLIITAAYGQMIPKEILAIPEFGILNVHPSLLPKYRGPSPIQEAIKNGDKNIGVSIILMDEKMDHGPVIAQKEIPLEEDDTYTIAEQKCAENVSQLLISAIPQWIQKTIRAKPQDENKATFTRLLAREDGHLDWTQKAAVIKRLIQAYEKWPQCYSLINLKGKNLKLKIIETQILKTKPKEKTGALTQYEKKLAVACKDYYLLIDKLQPEGKKVMTGEEFLRGYGENLGKALT